MTSATINNAAFASAPAQLHMCLGNLVQWRGHRFVAGVPVAFSAELLRSFTTFRELQWRFLEVLPLAVQLGHASALQANAFLDELSSFLADGGRLDGQRFGAYLQWAPDLEQQLEQLRDRGFATNTCTCCVKRGHNSRMRGMKPACRRPSGLPPNGTAI